MFTHKNEPSHEKMCLMSYANNKGADQPAHPHSLISAFVLRCLDSIISLDSIAEISRLYLASVAAKTGLCMASSETSEDTFCRVVAQIYGCTIRPLARYGLPPPRGNFVDHLFLKVQCLVNILQHLSPLAIGVLQ